jgi:hypothetical protein
MRPRGGRTQPSNTEARVLCARLDRLDLQGCICQSKTSSSDALRKSCRETRKLGDPLPRLVAKARAAVTRPSNRVPPIRAG